jgi:hypothetical protein
VSLDEKEICLYCKWWKPSDHAMPPGYEAHIATPGHCHVSSPVVTQWGSYSEGLTSATSWPKVNGSDFCGKFTGRRDDHASSNTSGDRNTSAPRETVVEPKSFDNWNTIGDLSVNILGRREELFQAVSETTDPKCDHHTKEQA